MSPPQLKTNISLQAHWLDPAAPQSVQLAAKLEV